MERKESVTLTRLEGKGVRSLEVGKGGIGNGERTMGKLGKWERKWKLECLGLERGKEGKERSRWGSGESGVGKEGQEGKKGTEVRIHVEWEGKLRVEGKEK